MPMPCSICNHADAPEINDAIRAGESNRAISKRFDVAKSSVHRHRKAGHQFLWLPPTEALIKQSRRPLPERELEAAAELLGSAAVPLREEYPMQSPEKPLSAAREGGSEGLRASRIRW